MPRADSVSITPPKAMPAAFREAWDTATAFDEARVEYCDGLRDRLMDRNALHGLRGNSFERAILATSADGLAGAMVQIEALALTVEYISAIQDPGEDLFQLCKYGFCSIFHVLERATGRSTADGLNIMLPDRDSTITDVPRVIALLEERPRRKASVSEQEAA